ncbi:hypothetical protein HLBENOHH_02463 [Aeromonas dhakensis]|uniref:hypothetical protein n=1 Tax=Aeromonas dhakensis TaxID=196024 RepID=UPI00366E940C
MGKLIGSLLSHIKNPYVKYGAIVVIGGAGAIGVATGVITVDDLVAIVTAAVGN